MSQVFAFFRDNADWLFGSSSVATILAAVVASLLKKKGRPSADQSSHVGGTANKTLQTTALTAQALFILIAVISAAFFLSGKIGSENTTDSTTINAGEQGRVEINKIEAGDNSTNTISTEGSSVTNQ